MATQRTDRWKRILPTATLTVIPFSWEIPVAQAFFPPVLPPPVVVVPPVLPPPVVVPPVGPPPFVPPPPPPAIVPPVCPPPVVVPPCKCNPRPACVPEPITLVSSVVGLAVVAGYRALRRSGKENTDTKGSDQTRVIRPIG